MWRLTHQVFGFYRGRDCGRAGGPVGGGPEQGGGWKVEKSGATVMHCGVIGRNLNVCDPYRGWGAITSRAAPPDVVQFLNREARAG